MDSKLSFKILSSEDIHKRLKTYNSKYNYQNKYKAFYSSYYDGVVTDPNLMMIPVDDHMVHRGDGVFEAIKTVSKKVYLLDEHLNRLEQSASKIFIDLPLSKLEIRKLILELLNYSNSQNSLKSSDFMIRLFVSRGPGGFTTNPYESIGSQLYIMITEFRPYAEKYYEEGVKIGWSKIQQKEPFFSTIKSCNYLQNVLMKKESVDRKLDFTIALDDKGFIAESSTENIFIIDKNNKIRIPSLNNILNGTVLLRLLKLINENSQFKSLKVIEGPISKIDLLEANEVLMIGTTLDVLPVVKCEDTLFSNGKAGQFSKKFRNLIRNDQQKCGILF